MAWCGKVPVALRVDKNCRPRGCSTSKKAPVASTKRHDRAGRLRLLVAHRPGDGVQIVARADDGVVEAIEVEGADQLVAVQWHPELLLGLPEHLALFEWLVAMAAATGVAAGSRAVTPARAR